MMSVLQILVGLTGLVSSVLLTLGLVGAPTRQMSPEPVVAAPPAATYAIDDMSHSVLPEGPARLAPAVAELKTPAASWQASLASLPSEPDADGADVLRVCRVTAYCDRGQTASGVPSGLGQCAAPADIPFGSKVYVPALDRTFVVTDRTHRRFRRSTVDIFLPTKKQCRNFGRRFLECEFTLPERGAAR